ncbi:armadillo-like helical domain-containing protein 4 isoform X2 [Narcine bancroftii]|uniref:armadillo-like helical domain-containing protein 4 isoform X2 n=1 Tax=Narcine bancroftii TaxID=1343680 RepID=UPI003831B5F8
MQSTEFYICMVTLAILICIPELRCFSIRKHHRRMFDVSTAKQEDIKSYNEDSNVTNDIALSGERVSSTASSNSLKSLETFTAELNTSIDDMKEIRQTSNENVITLTSLDILLTTPTMTPFQKPLNISTKDDKFNKNIQTIQKALSTNSTSNHAFGVSDVHITTKVKLNDTATYNTEKTGGTKNNEQMTEHITISTLIKMITKNGSGETTGTTDSSSENVTTALALISRTIQTVSNATVLTSEMLNFSEFTNATAEYVSKEETVTTEPVGNSFIWKANTPSAGKKTNEIMATTGSAVTDSKAPNTFQVTTTPRVTTAIKDTGITATVPSTSVDTTTETAQTIQITRTAAIIGTTKKMFKGLSERLTMTNGIPAAKSTLSTPHLTMQPILEVNTDSTKEMPSVTPTELVFQHTIESGTKISQAITGVMTGLQAISKKAKKTSAGVSNSTDRTLMLLLTTTGPAVGATRPPSSSEEELESEGVSATTSLEQKSVDLNRKNISATTAELNTETSHATLQTSISRPMGATIATSSLSPPVLSDNMSTLGVTTSPSIMQSEPPTYTLDTTDSEEEDGNEDEEEDEDEDIDLDEDSMDYDTEVPSLSYVTPGGPKRGNGNLTKVMGVSYQLPDSFEWNQHDQGTKSLVRSWLEKIKNKAGYMSGMLVPVAVGVAGALFILGALYSLKMVNRKRKNVFKRRETKPRDFTSMQDRVMLLADSSEDEF